VKNWRDFAEKKGWDVFVYGSKNMKVNKNVAISKDGFDLLYDLAEHPLHFVGKAFYSKST